MKRKWKIILSTAPKRGVLLSEMVLKLKKHGPVLVRYKKTCTFVPKNIKYL
jgi:hypothetical protein